MDSASGSVAAVPPEIIEGFRRDGFVIVADLVGADELDEVTPPITRSVAARKAHDLHDPADRSRHEQPFLHCQNLWEDTPEVRPLTFHPLVAAAAAALIGAEAVRLWHDQALFKEPGGRISEPHQDHPFWPIAEARTVTAWVPLDGASLVNGCLGYLAGSHRSGLRRFVNIFVGDPDELLASPALNGTEPTFVEVPRGSVAFHHGLTAHLDRPNTTDRVRRVHTMTYFADGCTRSSDERHDSVDRTGIGVGSAIDGPVTPIAWPRPNGDYPPLPPPRASLRRP